jgi:hypothetical protein
LVGSLVGSCDTPREARASQAVPHQTLEPTNELTLFIASSNPRRITPRATRLVDQRLIVGAPP